MRHLVPVVLFAVCCVAPWAPRARACTASSCWGTGFAPAGGTIPANAPAVAYWPPYSGVPPLTASDFQLLDGTTPVPFTLASAAGDRPVVLTLDAPLVEGHTYSLTEYAPTCAGMTTFTAGPVAPLPTTLGTLTATSTGATTVETSCYASVFEVGATVTLELSPDVTPWEPVLSYDVLVDGIRSPGFGEWGTWGQAPHVTAGDGTYAGRGRIHIADVCGADACHVTAPGTRTHHVQFRATVIGTSTVLESAPIDVTLTCPPSITGCPAGAPDGGSGTGSDGGVVDGGPATGAAPRSGACSVSRGAPGGAALVAFLVAALALGRRRVRSRPRTQQPLGRHATSTAPYVSP